MDEGEIHREPSSTYQPSDQSSGPPGSPLDDHLEERMEAPPTDHSLLAAKEVDQRANGQPSSSSSHAHPTPSSHQLGPPHGLAGGMEPPTGNLSLTAPKSAAQERLKRMANDKPSSSSHSQHSRQLGPPPGLPQEALMDEAMEPPTSSRSLLAPKSEQRRVANGHSSHSSHYRTSYQFSSLPGLPQDKGVHAYGHLSLLAPKDERQSRVEPSSSSYSRSLLLDRYGCPPGLEPPTGYVSVLVPVEPSQRRGESSASSSHSRYHQSERYGRPPGMHEALMDEEIEEEGDRIQRRPGRWEAYGARSSSSAQPHLADPSESRSHMPYRRDPREEELIAAGNNRRMENDLLAEDRVEQSNFTIIKMPISRPTSNVVTQTRNQPTAPHSMPSQQKRKGRPPKPKIGQLTAAAQPIQQPVQQPDQRKQELRAVLQAKEEEMRTLQRQLAELEQQEQASHADSQDQSMEEAEEYHRVDHLVLDDNEFQEEEEEDDDCFVVYKKIQRDGRGRSRTTRPNTNGRVSGTPHHQFTTPAGQRLAQYANSAPQPLTRDWPSSHSVPARPSNAAMRLLRYAEPDNGPMQHNAFPAQQYPPHVQPYFYQQYHTPANHLSFPSRRRDSSTSSVECLVAMPETVETRQRIEQKTRQRIQREKMNAKKNGRAATPFSTLKTPKSVQEPAGASTELPRQTELSRPVPEVSAASSTAPLKEKRRVGKTSRTLASSDEDYVPSGRLSTSTAPARKKRSVGNASRTQPSSDEEYVPSDGPSISTAPARKKRGVGKSRTIASSDEEYVPSNRQSTSAAQARKKRVVGKSSRAQSSSEEESVPPPRKKREDRQFSPVVEGNLWPRKKENPPIRSVRSRSSTPIPSLKTPNSVLQPSEASGPVHRSSGSSRPVQGSSGASRSAQGSSEASTPAQGSSHAPVQVAAGVTGALRGASGASRSAQDRKEALRIRDENLLIKHELHYPGKVYCLAKKGTVDEHGGKNFVQEINDQCEETRLQWKQRAKAMERKGEAYVEDYVVGCTKFDGLWDEADRNMKVMVLMKYGSFPKGYWTGYATKEHAVDGGRAIQEFRWRQQILSQVEVAMRKECAERGEDFDKMYPEVHLKMVRSQIVDGYAMDEENDKRTMLRAREATINACLKAVNLAPIILENWTGDHKDDENVLDFIWTNYIHASKKVQRALDKSDHNLTHKCGEKCPCAEASEVSKECNCQKTKCTTEMEIAHVECSDECKCTVDKCASRVLQRGRQHPIVIMAHPVKGYTIRAAEFQASGEFVSEYAGDILTAYENSLLPQTYSTDLTDVIVDMEKPSNLATHKKREAKRGKKNRKVVDSNNQEVDGHYHRAFVNSALKRGNESRYCSHHCRPNMAIRVRYIERKNFAFAHFGLFMTKDARPGDELTWNYHGEQLEQARKKKQPFKSDLLPECDCKAIDCMIKKWSECTATDNEAGDDEDEKIEYDSFSEDEEELTVQEKRDKAEKEREARRNKRLSARGETIDEEEAGPSSKGSSIENDTPPPDSPQL